MRSVFKRSNVAKLTKIGGLVTFYREYKQVSGQHKRRHNKQEPEKE